MTTTVTTYTFLKPIATFAHSERLVPGSEFWITRASGEFIHALSVDEVFRGLGAVGSDESKSHLDAEDYFDVFAEMAQMHSIPLKVWLPSQNFPNDAVRFRIVGEEGSCLIVEITARRTE